MLFKIFIASFVTVVVCEMFDSELFPFAWLERAIKERRQRPMTLANQLGLFPRLPHYVNPEKITDPSDITHMLEGLCNGDITMNLAHIFQDVFMSNSQAHTVVQESRMELQNSGNSNSSRNSSFIESERTFQVIGRSNSDSSNSHSGSCCETEMRITAPYTVIENGRRLQVVHMNTSYQFVNEGVCVNPRARCSGHGECVQVYKYDFMLLYDPLLTNVFPPVRFGRIRVKSHCECMNIGS